MPVKLNGSCHCGTIRFSVQSSSPVPYQLCLCSICRKVGGIGGSINLGAHSNTFKIIQGKEHLKIYRAVLDRDTLQQRVATSERIFCSQCSSMLWLYDPRWPEFLHPFASAIDSPQLSSPETIVCVKTVDKPGYVRLPEGDKEIYADYGPLSLDEWHKENGLYIK